MPKTITIRPTKSLRDATKFTNWNHIERLLFVLREYEDAPVDWITTQDMGQPEEFVIMYANGEFAEIIEEEPDA